MLKKEDRKININRTTEIIFGTLMAAVSLSLIVLSLFIAVSGGISRTFNDPKGITIFSVPASFAIFFSVIAVNLLASRKRSPNEELMSVNSWRTLAILMFAIAVSVFFIGSWYGAIIPVVIGAICLIKDPKIRELYQSWI